MACLAISGCNASSKAPVPAATAPAVAPSPTAGSQGARPNITVPAVVPTLDVSRQGVPLDQIYFDTFQPINRAVPLSEASPELIERLRDAIPPLHNPQYDVAQEVTWLADGDMVLGYVVGEQAWAYPVRILNFHEIVNDTLAGEPVLVSYCPLCYSGIVFSRRLGERVLTFGNTSALYESDMVMLDYETGSYWWQVAGEAIVGPLTGQRLTVLPGVMITWQEWLRLYPDSKVLSRGTGYERSYERDPFVGYADFLNQGRFAFPVSSAGEDPRLSPGEIVLAVQAGEAVRAYPLASFGEAAIMDQVGGQRVVLFVAPGGPSGRAYLAELEGRPLTFERRDGQFVDRETGSRWTLAGEAVEGALAGARLQPLPARTAFWFAIVAAEPEVSVYSVDLE